MRVRVYSRPISYDAYETLSTLKNEYGHYLYSFLSDSQDLGAIKDHLARPKFKAITAALVLTENGDYSDILVTYDNVFTARDWYRVTIKYYS